MEKRTNRKKKRKPRIFRRILFTILLVILMVGGYAAYQFYQGVKQAGDTEKQDFEFNGEKDANGRINVLLIGIDKREGDQKSHSDTMMVAQYDPKTDQAKIVSLMRDMYVPIPGYADNKLNTAYFLGGPELLRKTLKQDFDIDVQYYMMIDFKGFEHAIDALAPDGIEINVEKAMSKNIGVSLQPGVQKLNGKELLGYARFRHDSESDFGRVRRQQQVIKVVTNEITSANGLAKAPKMLGTIQPYVQTNISAIDRLSLMKELFFFNTNNIKSLTLPIKDTYSDARIDGKGLVLQVDMEKNKQAVSQFLNK